MASKSNKSPGKCLRCKKMLSDGLAVCPYCGYNNRTGSMVWMLVGAAILIGAGILSGILIVTIIGCLITALPVISSIITRGSADAKQKEEVGQSIEQSAGYFDVSTKKVVLPAKQAKSKPSERRDAYQAYLRTPEWKAIRAERLKMDNNECQLCGSRKNLQVHHKKYKEDWQDTTLDDLITLCSRCHKRHHAALHK